MSSINERQADYKLNKSIFCVKYGDITKLQADALVSSDDNLLTMGGGVSLALLRAGGQSIYNEARKHIPLKLGDVVVTSAGQLPAKYIFHAGTLDFSDISGPTEQNIRDATFKSLQLADTLGVRTIAFPALGTGIARFPFQLAAQTMTNTLAEYLHGDTQIELATITLLAVELTTARDINILADQDLMWLTGKNVLCHGDRAKYVEKEKRHCECHSIDE
ncbi:macro domain-containing protein [Chloroflexi bacterium TSY]|nr:macro domain-containing protein [Chloroflexi bacterium TSY]